jgi:hypothetical protein
MSPETLSIQKLVYEEESSKEAEMGPYGAQDLNELLLNSGEQALPKDVLIGKQIQTKTFA